MFLIIAFVAALLTLICVAIFIFDGLFVRPCPLWWFRLVDTAESVGAVFPVVTAASVVIHVCICGFL